MHLSGKAYLNGRGRDALDRQSFNGQHVRFKLRFRYAHRCTLSASPVEDGLETGCTAFDSVHTQASGIFGSPVGTQLQVRKTGF